MNNLRDLELSERMYAADVSIRGDNPELGKIKMTGLKIKNFHAKVKPECEIDMEENPQLTSLSRVHIFPIGNKLNIVLLLLFQILHLRLFPSLRRFHHHRLLYLE